MKLTFIGADHEVTGSCHYIEACGKKILLDCGMEQGRDVYVNQQIPVPVTDIDYVFLSHAHIDHSGYLPLIVKNGFKGKIFSTKATAQLCSIMLLDSAHIQEFEAEWRNRKAKRAGKAKIEPLYETKDAEAACKLFEPCRYGEIIDVCDGVQIRFTDIGHLIGSASIELWLTEGDVKKKIVFSGDIGNIDQPIIEDPHTTDDADYVIMESTYGDRLHEENVDYIKELVQIIQRTFDRGGNVIIPCFAVGRTQNMLYFLRKIYYDKLIKGHNLTVYVDSPLAVEAINIFNRNIEGYFDEEAMELVRNGINPIVFDGVKLSISADDSKMINFDSNPKVILSASGMCEAGRIRHHLKHNLWRKECSVVFVGYQGEGTLGRNLIEGAKSVKLFGETIEVNAEIIRLEGVSGHADKNGLIKWVNSFAKKPKKVFVVHGDDAVCDSFAAELKNTYGFDVFAPYSGAQVDLATGEILFEGVKELIERNDDGRPISKEKAGASYKTLLEAGERISDIIEKSRYGANKDMIKLARIINEMCDKWEKY